MCCCLWSECRSELPWISRQQYSFASTSRSSIPTIHSWLVSCLTTSQSNEINILMWVSLSVLCGRNRFYNTTDFFLRILIWTYLFWSGICHFVQFLLQKNSLCFFREIIKTVVETTEPEKAAFWFSHRWGQQAPPLLTQSTGVWQALLAMFVSHGRRHKLLSLRSLCFFTEWTRLTWAVLESHCLA